MGLLVVGMTVTRSRDQRELESLAVRSVPHSGLPRPPLYSGEVRTTVDAGWGPDTVDGCAWQCRSHFCKFPLRQWLPDGFLPNGCLPDGYL